MLFATKIFMTFKDLKISNSILKALEEKGYQCPTPIQEKTIPVILNNQDVLALAQTGTGKTAAFAVPLLQSLAGEAVKKDSRRIRALILTPTRELAIQISECFTEYGKYTGIRHGVIYGGVKPKQQIDQLRKGVDVLIATPGRLLDLIGQGYIVLNSIRHFVLDEADQMLDMGFIHDIKKVIVRLPKQRQTLLFSATMPPTIESLSRSLQEKPTRISVTPKQITVDAISQHIYYVEKEEKKNLLLDILKEDSNDSVLVFSKTKYGADKISKLLSKAGISSGAIHGNKSQNNRQETLNNFKCGKIRVLIATDIAARGIDLIELKLVINYDLPDVPETYVHRIGRTGRAGNGGTALSFCSKEEHSSLKDIQKLIGKKINVLSA